MRKLSAVGTATAIAIPGLSAGLAITVTRVLPDDTSPAVGTTVSVCTLLAASLVLIHAWVTDTSADRHRLRTAAADAEQQRARFIAADAALQRERERLKVDLHDSYAQLMRQVRDERARLHQEFDDRRTELVTQTFETAVHMVQRGLLDDTTADQAATVVPFPTRQARDERAGSHPG